MTIHNAPEPKPQPHADPEHPQPEAQDAPPTSRLKPLLRLLDEATPNDGRAIIGLSLAASLFLIASVFIALIPPSLVPAVSNLAIALLLADSPVLALVPKRWPELRRGVRVFAVSLLVAAVGFNVISASDSSNQGQMGTQRCLRIVSGIAPAQHSPRSPQDELRSELSTLGHAMCDDIAAGRS